MSSCDVLTRVGHHIGDLRGPTGVRPWASILRAVHGRRHQAITKAASTLGRQSPSCSLVNEVQNCDESRF